MLTTHESLLIIKRQTVRDTIRAKISFKKNVIINDIGKKKLKFSKEKLNFDLETLLLLLI